MTTETLFTDFDNFLWGRIEVVQRTPAELIVPSLDKLRPDWVGATTRLRRNGIETLGDLGRLAEAQGVDAALRLVAEASSRTG